MGEPRLEADCAMCAGLCCVAPAFVKSSEFAIDKPAGAPCRNLSDDFRCTIHTHLAERGFRGCVVFDCFGAGQRLVQETFGGRDWRSEPELASPMFACLPVLRGLHELLWLIAEALKLERAAPIHPDLRAAWQRIDQLANGTPTELRSIDVNAHRAAVNPLLQRASDLARAAVNGRRPDYRGADLIGRRMSGADLRGASFRGALLLGADLRGADLRLADFTGADLRGADLRGADLRGALFLTSSQLRAAVTDSA